MEVCALVLEAARADEQARPQPLSSAVSLWCYAARDVQGWEYLHRGVGDGGRHTLLQSQHPVEGCSGCDARGDIPLDLGEEVLW